MAKKHTLTTESGYGVMVEVKGKNYTVSTVAGEIGTFKLKGGFFTAIEEDIPITVNEQQYIVAVRGNKVRLVANGTYLDNGKEFKAAVPAPAWVIAFYIANFAVIVVALGGALPVALACLGTVSCAKASKSNLPTIARVIICIVITLVVWGLFGGMLVASAGIMAS